jgi:hypothetical protein
MAGRYGPRTSRRVSSPAPLNRLPPKLLWPASSSSPAQIEPPKWGICLPPSLLDMM